MAQNEKSHPDITEPDRENRPASVSSSGLNSPEKRGPAKNPRRRSTEEDSAAPTDVSSKDVPSKLTSCEKAIEKYRQSKLPAARAMLEIQRKKLYGKRGYDTIEEYASERFDFSRQRWYQLASYAQIRDALAEKKKSTAVDIPLPKNEAQARPLQEYKETPDVLFEVWKQVTERRSSLTRKNVMTAVDEITGEDAGSDGDGDEEEDSNGGDPDGEKPGGENPEGEDSGPPGGENSSGSGTETELEKARRRLEGFPEGIDDELENIAAAAVDGWAETATSLKSAILRYEDTYSENGDSILVAVPWAMLNPELETASELAKEAVPLPDAEALNEVGVPLSYFDGSPPLGKIQDAYQNRAESSFAECPAGRWANYVSNLTGGILSGYHRSLDQDDSKADNPKADREWGSAPPILYPGRIGDLRSLSGSEDTADSDVNVAISTGLFSEHVPVWMIQSVLSAADESTFNVLFETAPDRDPSRVDFPEGARLGVTVSSQEEIGLAEARAREADVDATWLLCRAEDTLQIEDPSVFDAIEIFASEEAMPAV